VFAGSRKWNCKLHEVSDLLEPNGRTIEAGQEILDALAADRYGIAFSSLAYKNLLTKPIALSSDPGREYYAASMKSIIAGQYPLARTPHIFVNCAPTEPMDAKVKEFLLYVLSHQGQ
jgi:phosphate transport system substrate-binding protein